jgi:Flp pilus assembly protein TadG
MMATLFGGEAPMRRGQALLELALALSFLLLVLAGIADYGRALIVSVTLANAAREGAHYVARNPNDLAGARQLVRQEAANAGITLNDNDIIIVLPSPLQPGQPVTVQVRTQVPTIMARFLGLNYLTVGAKATAPLLAAQ